MYFITNTNTPTHTGRLATIITHYHPRPPFFLIGREKKSMRAPSPLSCPTRLEHVHVACGTSVLVLLDHTCRVGRMSAQLVVCDLTFQAFPGGEQWEVARLARVNEQLLRVAETHVQELHGENALERDDE